MSEGTNKLHGVDIFRAGEHRNKSYTPGDLDAIVSNFNRHSTGERPSLRVPVVIGHEEKQDMLERSDLPAAGWASRVYRDGDKLKADIEHVPPQVMRLLKGKAYRTTSAEVYDKVPHGISESGDGKMLRRIAFLGGDIPQVKSLDEIPVPEDYSESPSFDRFTPTTVHFHESVEMPDGAFACFSEVLPMNREEMLSELGSRGLDVSAITDAIPDELLADMLRVLSSQPEPEVPAEEEIAPEEGAMSPEEGMAPEEMPPEEGAVEGTPAGEFAPEEMPPEEVPAKAAEVPPEEEETPPEEHGEYDEDGMPMEAKDPDHARKMFEKAYYHVEKHCGSGAGAKMAEHLSRRHGELKITHDTNGTDEDEEGEEHTMPAKYSEQKLAAMVTAAVAKVLKASASTVKADLAELQKFREEQLASGKRAAIDRFIKAETLAGRILPYEVDPSNPANLRKRLLRADSRAVVEKFTEKGKTVKLTELDLQMREIRDRRPFKFSETLKAGAVNDSASAEESALAEHFEMFSEQFAKNGMSRDKLVAGYKAEKQFNPELTVKQFLRN